MRILLESKLDTSHKQFKAWRGQGHLLGAIGESVKVSVGAKDDGLALLVTVTLETLPDSGTVVEGTARRIEGQVRFIVLVNGIKNLTRIRP